MGTMIMLLYPIYQELMVVVEGGGTVYMSSLTKMLTLLNTVLYTVISAASRTELVYPTGCHYSKLTWDTSYPHGVFLP